ncbi:phospholipase A2 inhibitor subunit gamma B-like [Rhinatrema bivittatum]|uniref:phospholipase A2 inhibitor subunit gamma B-like n=1 Tax=Rhinatrema bivittatum TaxID=194408 RepID=UPI00112A02F0|nr:phospholipase A2 inhibitor subunit gamma B-like [Rhinatrema bivittatum]
MRAVLTGLCLLSALVAPGTSLQCQQCTSMNSNTCSSPPQECQSLHTHCISMLKETITGVGSSKMVTLIRSCGTNKHCDKVTSITAGSYHMMTMFKCCTKENCNTQQMSMPRTETDVNGLSCPSCYSLSSHTCDRKENTTCKGAEDRCIEYDVTVKTGTMEAKSAVHGCATRNLCESKDNPAYYKDNYEMNFKCSSGTHPQLGLFLLAVTGLIFLKVFS